MKSSRRRLPTPGEVARRFPNDNARPVLRKISRHGAYVVCIEDDRILLSHLVFNRWTLPGGGIEFGEHPAEAAQREFTEETGFIVELDDLIGIDSSSWNERSTRHHSMRMIYTGHIVGGSLRYEVHGSTNEARWVPLDEVRTLTRVELVDRALELLRRRPSAGHLLNE
ncbi:NUDIX hydrolase [Micrococcales bacterium 31B]|nr:NUDIX hydrolase [Micrococcales bacterium 31B]